MTDPLIEAARQARLRAFAPYSRFLVGAAWETETGEIISGCNVESASYGLTICAERVALVKAISEGKRGFRRVAVVTDVRQLTPPCGACRQLLWEFAPESTVILANLAGDQQSFPMRDLLPFGFDASQFEVPGDSP
jgi:cytidine deaminase